MKIGYVINVEFITHTWPNAFYLIDDETLNTVKTFSSMDELNIYADLNGYEIKDISEKFFPRKW